MESHQYPWKEMLSAAKNTNMQKYITCVFILICMYHMDRISDLIMLKVSQRSWIGDLIFLKLSPRSLIGDWINWKVSQWSWIGDWIFLKLSQISWIGDWIFLKLSQRSWIGDWIFLKVQQRSEIAEYQNAILDVEIQVYVDLWRRDMHGWYLQETATSLGPQNRTQGRCAL